MGRFGLSGVVVVFVTVENVLMLLVLGLLVVELTLLVAGKEDELTQDVNGVLAAALFAFFFFRDSWC